MKMALFLPVVTLLIQGMTGCQDIAFLNTLEKMVLGYKWTLVTDSAEWGPRRGHSTVVYDGKLWVIGGMTGSAFLSDVWSSSDGKTWTRATNAALWGGRYLHTSVVYDNKMWVMGGRYDFGSSYEAWRSDTGSAWSLATAALPVTYSVAIAGSVFVGKMWILAGWDNITNVNDSNEVWYSTNVDGSAWAAATTAAPWPVRSAPATVVYDDKLWIMGGKYDPSNSNYNDVWYTADGANWSEFRGTVPWSKRRGHSCIVFNEKIFLMGGWDGTTVYGDVWSFGR